LSEDEALRQALALSSADHVQHRHHQHAQQQWSAVESESLALVAEEAVVVDDDAVQAPSLPTALSPGTAVGLGLGLGLAASPSPDAARKLPQQEKSHHPTHQQQQPPLAEWTSRG
jgi:hypothetical protein